MQNHFLNFSRSISDSDREKNEVQFLDTEISTAIKNLNTDSSPGPDGMTSRFYQFFSKELIPYLSLYFKEIHAHGKLAESHTLSYITLLPKEEDKKLRTKPKNYRPISLLNSEYKILTSILASRVGPHLEELVHKDQTCSVRNRNIFQHCHFLRDLISSTYKTNDHICILSIDQAKAFDRVAHDWLFKVIDKCNLGSLVSSWIRILYKSAKSQVIVNHSLSDSFNIKRGVRQGDPLSPLLYILSIEPLLNKIRLDVGIKPIRLPGGLLRKLLGYADDTIFTLQQHSAIDKIIYHFKYFSKASGSSINVDKTKALALGSWNPNIHLEFKIKYVKIIKIYGLFYTKLPQECGLQNWKDALEAAHQTLPKLICRSASIFGKASLINVLIHSKFIYPIQTFDPPESVYKKYNKTVRPFILKGMTDGIHDSTLRLPRENGGISLHDLKLKRISCRMKFIKDYLDNGQETRMAFADYYLSTTARDVLGFDNNKPHASYENTPIFYRNLINIYKNKLFKETILKIDKKKFYDCINVLNEERVKEIRNTMPRLLPHQNFQNIFKTLHSTKKTTPKQKQITYRLLFGSTGTWYYKHKNTGAFFPCSLCGRVQDSENHLFFGCQENLRGILLRRLRLPHNTRDYSTVMHNAVFLNMFPFSNTVEKDYRNVVLGIYRETLWTACIDARHNNRNITPEHVKAIFLGRLEHALSNKFSLKELAQIDKMSQYESSSESSTNTSTEVNVSNSASEPFDDISNLNLSDSNSSSSNDSQSGRESESECESASSYTSGSSTSSEESL